MSGYSCPSVPVSWGELLDKLSILEIKLERIHCASSRDNVEKEYRILKTAAASTLEIAETARLFEYLRRINEALWDVEDALRKHEAHARFDPAFIALARCVYKTNDDRAAVKRAINNLLKSDIVEEKSYTAEPPLGQHQTRFTRDADEEEALLMPHSNSSR